MVTLFPRELHALIRSDGRARKLVDLSDISTLVVRLSVEGNEEEEIRGQERTSEDAGTQVTCASTERHHTWLEGVQDL